VQTSIREHRQIVARWRGSAAGYEQAVFAHLAGGKVDYQRIFLGGDG
jgi:hypothetical protein